jgi:membrane protease YdiL (CAAX protease family)
MLAGRAPDHGSARLLEDRSGTTIALILSAAAFTFVHAGNHGATWVSTLSIALESDALMGLAYAATRTLWPPIGLHFGWNSTERAYLWRRGLGRAVHGSYCRTTLRASFHYWGCLWS